jgi:hypothetical protein
MNPAQANRFSIVAVAIAAMFCVAILLSGRYQLAGSPNPRLIWRIDTMTGDLSMCEVAGEWQSGPVCTPWSNKPLPANLPK